MWNDCADKTKDDAAFFQDHGDDPVQEEELISLVSDLSDDVQIDIVTHIWLGRE